MGRRDRRRAGPALRIPDALLDALHPAPSDMSGAVAQLSAGLIKQRKAAGQAYLADPRLRAAYARYYLCANAPKLWPILDRLDLPDVVRALELGGGPGTGVASLTLWCAENNRALDLTTTDALRENVRDACALGRRLGAEPRGRVHRIGDKADLGSGYDLVLLMNVVNELPESADAALIETLERTCAGVVVVIEPAAQEPSRRALALRDSLCAAGWSIPLPCPQDGPCPARADGDWCHDEWRFVRPDFMVAVDKAVGTRREVLKATWFVAQKRPASRDGWVRVIGARQDNKGRVRVPICGPDGLATVELQKRDRTADNEAAWSASRFDRLAVAGSTPVADALRLGPEARCERLDDRLNT